MTTDEKLAAIQSAVQTDPGGRGLARDPNDNLFRATAGDFPAACRDIVAATNPTVALTTGFFIPTARPPAFETDGPLGAIFLRRALQACEIPVCYHCEEALSRILAAAHRRCHIPDDPGKGEAERCSHRIAIERSGPGPDGRHYTMRGRDVTEHHDAGLTRWFEQTGRTCGLRVTTIGIGDGGNEIGMGKIAHETIVKNIPNGDRIHCRVATDHLVVAGVSNWGAYALAAGVLLLRGRSPPADLFDPDQERAILEVLVREGPLVDGVTGQPSVSVDGLSWEEYVKPLVRIREILESK
jgi:hypothetical protein